MRWPMMNFMKTIEQRYEIIKHQREIAKEQEITSIESYKLTTQ